MGSPVFSRIRFTLTLIVCTLVVFGSITTWWVERQLSGPLVEWARLRATNMATEAINRAVEDVRVEYSRAGEIVRFVNNPGSGQPFIRYDMGAVNQMIANAVARIMEAFRAKEPQEFSVPLGELSGMRIFAAWGPPLPVRILTTGSVVAVPKVDFRAAGINQVVHRMYLDVTVRMIIFAPLIEEEIVVAQPVILTEEIFPGSVPSTYVNLVGYSGGLAEWGALLESFRQSGSGDPGGAAAPGGGAGGAAR